MNTRPSIAFVAAGILMMFAFPILANAQTNIGSPADIACVTFCQMMAAQKPPKICPTPPALKPCQAVAPGGGTVAGICMPTGCMAQSASGLGGGNSMSSLSQLAGQIGQLLGQLMKGSSSGDSGSGSTPATTGCTTAYYYTSNTALIGVDPCAMYQASAASELTTTTGTTSDTSAQDLLNSLTGTSGSGTDSLNANPTSGSSPLTVSFSATPLSTDTGPFSVDFGDGSTPQPIVSSGCSNATAGCVYQVTYTYATAGTYIANLEDVDGLTLASATISVTNPGGPTNTQTGTGISQVLSNVGNFLEGNSSSSTTQGSSQSSAGFPGVFGNILLGNNGATIYGATISGSSETSGFYGSDTLNGQSTGVAGQLCQSRPWASNFLADVIPPSFFDSLCQWGGYQVGEPQPAPTADQPQVTLQQQPQQQVQHQATTTAATSTVPAQAEIWAVPSEVPLGARTSIFWQAQGVVSCVETSPNGSFSENSLDGAASTVPLTEATTFTISCTDANGNPVTNYVTVTLSS